MNSTILDFFPKTTGREIFKIFSVYFVIGVVAILTLTGFVTQIEYQRGKARRAEDGSRNLQLAVAATHLDLELLATDLQTIANSPSLGRYLQSPGPEALATLTSRWQTFVRDRKGYEQIRYVGLDGENAFGVAARKATSPGSGNDPGLSRKDRTLLQEALQLEWGDIFVSPPDLPTGAGESDPSPVPAVQVASPVFDPFGTKQGVIIINLGVTMLHHRLAEACAAQENTQCMIVDGDGSWVTGLHPERGLPVLSAVDGGTLGAVRPELWAAVRSAETGRLLTADGLYAFSTISAEKVIGQAAATSVGETTEKNGPSPRNSHAWHFIALIPGSELSYLHFLRQYLHILWVVPLVILALGAQTLHLAIIRANKDKKERSLNLLATAIEQSPTAVVITDIGGRIRSVNSNFLEMSGYRRAEVVGKNPRIFKSGHTPGETYRELWRTIRSGHVWVGDLENRRKDGTPYFVATKISPIFEKPGKITGFLALQEDVTETRRLQKELERLATTDGLTGAYNRNHFLTLFKQEFRRAERYDQPLSVLVLDIDHFKAINDTYGHHAGDRVLGMFAEVVSSILRDEDLLGRLGGEEFGVVLVQTPSDGATLLAERLRRVVETMVVECDGHPIRVTVSAGGAAMERVDRAIETILRRADKALYVAKRHGRNRVRFESAQDDDAVSA